jgi:hypothetical protein
LDAPMGRGGHENKDKNENIMILRIVTSARWIQSKDAERNERISSKGEAAVIETWKMVIGAAIIQMGCEHLHQTVFSLHQRQTWDDREFESLLFR